MLKVLQSGDVASRRASQSEAALHYEQAQARASAAHGTDVRELLLRLTGIEDIDEFRPELLPSTDSHPASEENESKESTRKSVAKQLLRNSSAAMDELRRFWDDFRGQP